MKNKRILPVQQREQILKEVQARFRDCETKCREHATGQYAFLYLLSTAIVLTDVYDFDPDKRFEAINCIKDTLLTISDFLCSNKCQIGQQKKEVYDVDANLAYMERFCREYGMTFDERIFEELNYDEI